MMMEAGSAWRAAWFMPALAGAGTAVVVLLVQLALPAVVLLPAVPTAVAHAALAVVLLSGWPFGPAARLCLWAWAALVVATVAGELWGVPAPWVTAHAMAVLLGSLLALEQVRRQLRQPA